MKTTFKIIGIIFLLLVVAVIAMPFLFKGKLTELAKEEINKNLNASVGFTDFSLSIFKNFPDFTLGIEGLSVVGKGSFEGDTLAYIPSLDITVDLFSVIKGSTYQVKKINVISPSILVKYLEDGTANYDIVPEGEEDSETPAGEDGEAGAFVLELKSFNIKDGHIKYQDNSSSISLLLKGLEFNLTGDLTADETTLKTSLTINEMDLTYEGIPYFTRTRVKYIADINADLKNEIYTLKKNSLFLNDLALAFDGSVSMVGDDINIVMAFGAQKADFKTFLSLIPAIYTRDYATVQATGKLGVDGNIKGIYNDNTLPEFSVNLEVSDGQFKYPDLPQSVSNIQLKAGITNPGGDADNTVIDVSAFHMQLGANPLDIRLLVKTPVSDPDINGHVKGKIDLASVKDYYPLEPGEEVEGTVIADVTLQGKLSALDNEDYESFTAIGSLLMQKMSYRSTLFNEPVEISNAQLNFSPRYLDLVSFNCKIGANDLSATGKISNYLSYTFNDGVLSGNLDTRSNRMDLNTLMTDSEAEGDAGEPTSDTAAMSIMEVPGNIDFEMTSSFSQLIYDTYDMRNVNGRLTIRDKVLSLRNLSMNILDGEMSVSGEYITTEPEKPSIDFVLDITNIDIQEACKTFGVMEKYAPIANKTKGKFSSRLTMKSLLDKEMMPVYETMTGGGRLETSTLNIQDVNTLDKIADALKYEPLKNLSLDKILLKFEFIDGKVLIEPFDLKQKNFTGTMAGWTGFDQSISYTLNMNIPRESFGKEANNILNNLVSQANSKGANISLGETVSMDVLIGGTLTNPEIKTNLKETGKNLVEDVKKKVEEEIQKQKEELSKQAKEEAQRILDEADKKAAQLQAEASKQAQNIRKNAADAAKKVRDEAEKQAKNIEAEGKKKGFLAEAAAKETAKQVKKEGEKQAKNIEDEADRQAKALVDKADQEAAQIRKNAQVEADKILGKI